MPVNLEKGGERDKKTQEINTGKFTRHYDLAFPFSLPHWSYTCFFTNGLVMRPKCNPESFTYQYQDQNLWSEQSSLVHRKAEKEVCWETRKKSCIVQGVQPEIKPIYKHVEVKRRPFISCHDCLLASSSYAFPVPFCTYDDPEPRPYKWPQYLASSMWSSKNI